MSVQTLEPDKVRVRGMRALVKELGPAGMVQFRSGWGDYTKDRHRLLDKLTVDDLLAGMRSKRQKHPAP